MYMVENNFIGLQIFIVALYIDVVFWYHLIGVKKCLQSCFVEDEPLPYCMYISMYIHCTYLCYLERTNIM